MDNITIIRLLFASVFFCVSALLGYILIFGRTQKHQGNPTPLMRVSGIAIIVTMLSSAISGIIGGIYPQDYIFRVVRTIMDSFVITGALMIGYSLVERGYPKTKHLLWVLLPLLGETIICIVLHVSYLKGAIIFVAMMAVYLGLLCHRFYRHDKTLPMQYSSTQGHTTAWFIIFACLVLVVSPLYIYAMCVPEHQDEALIVVISSILVIYGFLYRNIRDHSTERVGPISYGDSFDLTDPKNRPTHKHNIFSKDEAVQIKEKLLKMMAEEKLYLNPDLCVEDITQRLGMNSSYFYYFMRDEMDTRFFDFVNGYRIEDCKKLLLEGLTVENTAKQCGFNSANSMNRVFKSLTGTTPAQWRDSQR